MSTKTAVIALNLFGDDPVRPNPSGGWDVASSSVPGGYRHVTADGVCDCPGYEHRQHCRHVAFLQAEGLLAKPEPTLPLPVTHVSRPVPGDERWIWTGRYASPAIPGSGLVPVQTSQGFPKFPLKYRIEERVPEIMPERWMLSLDLDRYTDAYTKKLESIGAGAILGILAGISQKHAGAGLILLCFEDLQHRPDLWCHRSIFSRWFERETGVVVHELAE